MHDHEGHEGHEEWLHNEPFEPFLQDLHIEVEQHPSQLLGEREPQIPALLLRVLRALRGRFSYAARSLEKSCDFLETVQVGLELLVGIGTRDRIGVGI